MAKFTLLALFGAATLAHAGRPGTDVTTTNVRPTGVTETVVTTTNGRPTGVTDTVVTTPVTNTNVRPTVATNTAVTNTAVTTGSQAWGNLDCDQYYQMASGEWSCWTGSSTSTNTGVTNTGVTNTGSLPVIPDGLDCTRYLLDGGVWGCAPATGNIVTNVEVQHTSGSAPVRIETITKDVFNVQYIDDPTPYYTTTITYENKPVDQVITTVRDVPVVTTVYEDQQVITIRYEKLPYTTVVVEEVVEVVTDNVYEYVNVEVITQTTRVVEQDEVTQEVREKRIDTYTDQIVVEVRNTDVPYNIYETIQRVTVEDVYVTNEVIMLQDRPYTTTNEITVVEQQPYQVVTTVVLEEQVVTTEIRANPVQVEEIQTIYRDVENVINTFETQTLYQDVEQIVIEERVTQEVVEVRTPKTEIVYQQEQITTETVEYIDNPVTQTIYQQTPYVIYEEEIVYTPKTQQKIVTITRDSEYYTDVVTVVVEEVVTVVTIIEELESPVVTRIPNYIDRPITEERIQYVDVIIGVGYVTDVTQSTQRSTEIVQDPIIRTAQDTSFTDTGRTVITGETRTYYTDSNGARYFIDSNNQQIFEDTEGCFYVNTTNIRVSASC